MKITITFDTDNAAFENGGFYSEVAAILDQAHIRIDNGIAGQLRDTNGNTVGEVRIDV